MIWIKMAFHVIDLLNFTFLLWIFRPRKQWPNFFTMEVGVAAQNDVGGRNNDGGNGNP